MKTVLVALMWIVLPALALAQAPSVTSTSPSDNAVNVPVSTATVSLTFNVAVDTSSFKPQSDGPAGGVLSNLDSLTGYSFSSDHRTVYLSVKLSVGKSYFVILFYAKSEAGLLLAVPYVFRFTTAESFPVASVSGNVYGGGTGVDPAYAVVAFNRGPISEKMDFVAGAVADANGAFTAPYVPDGTLYPVAAMDASQDGELNPSRGDPITTASPITVSGGNVLGLSITFSTISYRHYGEALDSLNAHVGSFSTPHVLRQIAAYYVDSTGAASEWLFKFTGGNPETSFDFRIEFFGGEIRPMDSSEYYWLSQNKPILTLPTPAAVDSFLARAEHSGGYLYRPVPMTWEGFDTRLVIGDIRMSGYWDMVPDTSQLYFGVTYWYGTENKQQSATISQRRFVGDWVSGSILGTTGVANDMHGSIPLSYSLRQNYPNPFNPVTTVAYQLPVAGNVRLAVYDILGREIAVLVNENKLPGSYQASFNAATLASGPYLYRLTAGHFAETRKMVILR